MNNKTLRGYSALLVDNDESRGYFANLVVNEIDAAFFKTSDYFTRFNLHFSWVHKRIGITNLVPYGKMKIELLLPCA